MNRSSINQVIQNLKKEQMSHEEKVMKHKTEADKLGMVVLTLEELTGAKKPAETDFVRIVGESTSKPVEVKSKRPSFELPWDKRVKSRGPKKGAKRGPYKLKSYDKAKGVTTDKKVPASIKKYKIQWGKEIKGMLDSKPVTKDLIMNTLVSTHGKNLITRNEKRIKKALGMMVYLKVAKMHDNIDPRLVSYSIV